jgi:hypothetical protein
VYHAGVLTLLLGTVLAGAVEVERVLAMVNGAPILASDIQLAELAELVPREAGEGDAAYRRAVANALVELELRWQDLETAALVPRIQVDFKAAWDGVLTRAGGEQALDAKLAAIGLDEQPLRELVRRAAVVEAYVAMRFAPFARPTPEEVVQAWQGELAPALRAKGQPVPPLNEVRDKVEALLRERKLAAEVTNWTDELEQRAEIARYFR